MDKLVVKSLELSEGDEKNVYVEGYASAAVKDLDNEIITEEALKLAAKELTEEPYNKVFLNHNYRDIPVGKIVEAEVRDGKLWVKLMLNKAHPQFETIYKSLKDGFLDAFSIGFKVLERKGNRIMRMKILEVSLVGVPANPQAVVEEVYEKMFDKEADVELTKGVVPGHPWRYSKDEEGGWKKPALSDFTDKSWEELSDSEKKSIAGHFAWAPANPPERFTDLKLPHHDPKSHAVVWRGVVAAMAALFGARGGVDIPAEDRKKVYNHLAAHYREFGREPPEFRFVEEFTAKLLEKDLSASVLPVGQPAYPGWGFTDVNSQPALKSLNSTKPNMSEEIEKKIEALTSELEKLKAENEALRKRLAEYEEREKAVIIEKIKKIAPDAEEEKLKEMSIAELKLALADYALKIIDNKAEKVKTPVEEGGEFIETKWGKADAKKVAELRKMLGVEVE